MAKPTIDDHNIIEKIKTKISAIVAGADYYYTYASSNVSDWYSGEPNLKNHDYWIDVKDNEEDMLEILESSDTLHDLNLMIDIDITAVGTRKDNIRKMKADILKCIGNNRTWDGLAFDTRYLGHFRNAVDHTLRKVADLRIRIEVQYRKNAWSIQ